MDYTSPLKSSLLLIMTVGTSLNTNGQRSRVCPAGLNVNCGVHIWKNYETCSLALVESCLRNMYSRSFKSLQEIKDESKSRRK